MRRARLAGVLQAQSKCLAGGYKRAIITITITFDKVFDVKQNKKHFSLEIFN